MGQTHPRMLKTHVMRGLRLACGPGELGSAYRGMFLTGRDCHAPPLTKLPRGEAAPFFESSRKRERVTIPDRFSDHLEFRIRSEQEFGRAALAEKRELLRRAASEVALASAPQRLFAATRLARETRERPLLVKRSRHTRPQAPHGIRTSPGPGKTQNLQMDQRAPLLHACDFRIGS